MPELIYYQFEDGDSEVANLASAPAGSNPATIAGLVTAGNGPFGDALANGGHSSSTHSVDTGWPMDLGAGSWTISFHAICFPSSSGTYYLFGSASNHFRCTLLDGTLMLQGDGITDVSIPNTYGIAMWTTFHFVYDATVPEIRAYREGALIDAVAQSALDITSTDNLLVGGYSTEDGMPGSGYMMDEFRVYNRALSAAEVFATYEMNLATPVWHTVSSPTVPLGRPVTYTVHLNNNYSEAPITALVTDTIPLILLSGEQQATLGPGVTAVPSRNDTWSVTNLAAGGVANTAEVIIPSGFEDTDTDNNSVTIHTYALDMPLVWR